MEGSGNEFGEELRSVHRSHGKIRDVSLKVVTASSSFKLARSHLQGRDLRENRHPGLESFLRAGFTCQCAIPALPPYFSKWLRAHYTPKFLFESASQFTVAN